MARTPRKLTEREAILALAGCQGSRLLLVTEALAQLGYHFSDEALAAAGAEAKEIAEKRKASQGKGLHWDRGAMVREKRKRQQHREWIGSHDEVTVALRKAYYNGLNFTLLAEKTGVAKATLYKALYGSRTIDYNRGVILEAIPECCTYEE